MATASSGQRWNINYSRVAEGVMIALLLGVFYCVVGLRDQVRDQQTLINEKLTVIANMKPIVDNTAVAVSNHELRLSDHERRMTSVESDVKSLSIAVARSRR